MKKKSLIEVISFLLMFLFLYTGISKLITFETFQFDMTRSPIVRNYPTFSAIALPTIEILISICLFVPKYRKWGLYSSLILMFTFTIYIFYMLKFTPDRPCTCGGVIRQMSWPNHLYFNAFFCILSLTGVLLYNRSSVTRLETKYSHI